MHLAPHQYSTSRLILRPWLPADRTPFARLNADAEVMHYLGGPIDSAASDALVQQLEHHFAAHGFGPWALERRDTGEFIGCAGLQRPSFAAPFTPCVEVAWRLMRHAWGNGYATEAANEACRIAFVELGLPEIVSFTVADNERSRNVMERLGMHHDPAEDFEHPRLAEGHPLRHHVLYRLSREKWV